MILPRTRGEKGGKWRGKRGRGKGQWEEGGEIRKKRKERMCMLDMVEF